ncbi:hypothetical protein RPATATE_0783 [Rickettsia parkeri str. Tate's Hell]|uniref:Uncharacterized protein n=1 Tax=Rickettsia parkeri str. Tate's Hell TaxID=1359189 RepID=A0ABR5DR49_RICPA|nr:hypothetical protein RPAAT24_0137 [Rickettsia parkeri str. AT\
MLGYDGFKKIPEFVWYTIGRIRDHVFEFIVQEPFNRIE